MGQFVAAYMMNIMDKFCLSWNGYDASIRETSRKLREDQRLFDVTLVTDDGQHIQAHKIILSAGSHFFGDIFLKSNQTNMLIYLKGVNSIHLEHLLDFIYNGEASVEHEELRAFLEAGEELQVKGFEAYVAGVGESVDEESVRYVNEKEEMYENKGNVSEFNSVCDPLEPSSEHFYFPVVDIDANTDVNLQILEMIEMSDGVWKCKVCGKTSKYKKDMREHAETHIEGMSHACHICNKSLSSRSSLRLHINNIHSELLSCDLCGKSGMNKQDIYNHKRRQHKTTSETLL